MNWMDTIVATHVKEDIPSGLRSHVFILRVTGVWPMADDSRWYKCLTIAFFVFVGILIPCSVCVNILFSHSFDEALDHLFLSITIWATTFKRSVIYWRRDSLRELFGIHAGLLHDDERNASNNDRIASTNFRMHVFFTAMYLCGWITDLVQSFFSKPQEAMYPSTSHWPYDFARKRSVFLVGMMLQALLMLGIIVWTAVADSLYLALINIAIGHVAQLKERLMALGTGFAGEGERDTQFYRNLIACCKRYEDCLR